jgi:hypothetical protein
MEGVPAGSTKEGVRPRRGAAAHAHGIDGPAHS